MKRLAAFFIGVLLTLTLVTPVGAANQVEQIDIRALVERDGTLSVSQTWTGNFSEGTELYLPLKLPKGVSLRRFTVEDESGPFAPVERWAVNENLEGKRGKSGVIKTLEGYELCFGIGQYGARTFTLHYVLNDAVGAYEDADGLSLCFVNAKMNTTPTALRLTLAREDGERLAREDCQVWAYGFDGKAALEDGVLHVTSKTPIEAEEHVSLVLRFSKGVLRPTRTEEGSAAVLNDSPALQGEKEAFGLAVDLVKILLPIGSALLLLALAAALFFWKRRHGSWPWKRGKENAYFSNLPNEGDRWATYALGLRFGLCEEGAAFCVGLLRLVDHGALLLQADERVGFLGKGKEKLSLHLAKAPDEKNPHADALDSVLYAALDGVLVEGQELQALSAEQRTTLLDYLAQYQARGEQYLTRKHCVLQEQSPAKLASLSVHGKQELREILGFRQYLQDFALMAEHQQGEDLLWQEYLSYGLLFDEADRLADQMKEVYPQQADEIMLYRPRVLTVQSYGQALWTALEKQGETAAEETAGAAT